MKLSFRLLMSVLVIAQLAACGGGGGTAGTATTTPPVTPPVTPPTATVGGVSLGTSLTAIATDGSSTATITATVVDASNNALSGIPVTFRTDNGLLGSAAAATSAAGTATVVLQNGSADFSNRTANVTVTAGTKSATIPVLLSGSTLALSQSGNTTTVGGADVTFTATARNSAPTNSGVPNQSVRFSIAAGSTGAGTLSALTGTTGPTGIAPSTGGAVVPVRLTPTAAGTVTVVAEWLNAAGAVSVTASQTVTVTAPGIDFAVTNPATSPSSLPLLSTQAFSLTVPTSIGGSAVANVRLAANAGRWSNNSPIVIKAPVLNLVTETYTPSVNAGTVTVTIEALSATNAPLATISQTIAVSAPASTAASVSLQAAASTLACECRRSWILSSGSSARSLITSHGRDRSTGQSPCSVGSTHADRRGREAITCRAGALSAIVFAPVLESGSLRHPRSKSTYSQRSPQISPRRAPEKRSSRIAAATVGMIFASTSRLT